MPCQHKLKRTCSNRRRRPASILDVAYFDYCVSISRCVVVHSVFAEIVAAAGHSYLKTSKKQLVPMNDLVSLPSKNRFVLASHESNHSLDVVPNSNHSETWSEKFSLFVRRGASPAFGHEKDHFLVPWVPNHPQATLLCPVLASVPYMRPDCRHIQEVEQPTTKSLGMTMFPHVHNGETSRAQEEMNLGLLPSN
jgi:hypothetical protein